MTQNLDGKNVVFFDGVCNLCNGAVNWLLDHDPHKRLHFAPLQGETFRVLAETLSSKPPQNLSTIVLYSEERVITHSTAILAIGVLLGGIWGILGIAGRIVPRFLRDAIYTFVAGHRYRWFGKRHECRIPTPETALRFLP